MTTAQVGLSYRAGQQAPLGAYYVSASAPTTVTTHGTPEKMAGTTTSLVENQFTHTDNRLTYVGTPTINVFVFCAISMTSGTNNVTARLYVAKGGVVIASSEIQRKIGTGADVGAAGVLAKTSLATNEYVEMFVDFVAGDGQVFTATQMLVLAQGY